MKKVLSIILLLVILVLGFTNRTALAQGIDALIYQYPCASPKTFTIGTIDNRFGISKSDFLKAAQEAGNIWQNAQGQGLFVYDHSSKLPISLLYDERQYLNNRVDSLNNQVIQQKNSLKPEIAEYEKRAAAFKKRNADLNARIDYWNGKGGAPSDEYDKLMTEQKSLQTEAQALQKEAETLNQSTDAYNQQIQELDKRVEDYNQTLAVKPEEGEYIKNGNDEKILLYFNNSHDELVHTLAHEMGHALGMGHNNNPNSIMYPKTSKVIIPSPDDLTALGEVCKKRTLLQTIEEKFVYVANMLHAFLTGIFNKNTSQ